MRHGLGDFGERDSALERGTDGFRSSLRIILEHRSDERIEVGAEPLIAGCQEG